MTFKKCVVVSGSSAVLPQEKFIGRIYKVDRERKTSRRVELQKIKRGENKYLTSLVLFFLFLLIESLTSN